MRRLPRYAHRTPQLSAAEGQCRRAAPWLEAEPTRYSNRIHAHLRRRHIRHVHPEEEDRRAPAPAKHRHVYLGTSAALVTRLRA
jgi:hypothetical protein